MRLSPPAPAVALRFLTASLPAWAGPRLLPVALLLPLLAGCAGASPAATTDAAALPSGGTVDAIRGTPGLGEPLRPEPGNIWADGLTPSATAPSPMGLPGR
ncbi:hypothetical protein [Roseomonas sp. 18066]|uniref:hypothetical protein n=1 Tax=Roseomonas sp. 18066 TaxID=2681412 RepID=UPI001356B633|nr:hypothetical protein [Roseomonas sp. 18066]